MLKWIIVVSALLIGTMAYADSTVKSTENNIVEGFKNIGQNTGKAFEKRKELGRGFKEAGKDIGGEPRNSERSGGDSKDFRRKAGEAFEQVKMAFKKLFNRKGR